MDATLVYDDDCGFCTWWADRFRERSDVRVVGFSEVSDEVRERLPEDYRECSHLLVDGEVRSCGASIEEAFVRSDLGEGFRPLVEFLHHFEDYRRLRERAYRAVADRRTTLGQVFFDEPSAGSESGE